MEKFKLAPCCMLRGGIAAVSSELQKTAAVISQNPSAPTEGAQTRVKFFK